MGENALALLRYLSSPASPLPSLTSGYKPPTTVFFTNLSWLIIYSYRTAKIVYTLFFAASLVLVRVIFVDPAPALRRRKGLWREQARGVVAVLVGAGGTLVGANVAAVVMQRVLGKGMSWFSSELSTLALYGPAALTGLAYVHMYNMYIILTSLTAGALISQLPLGRIREQTMFTSLLLVQSFFACIIQFAGIGSAGLLFLSALPLFFSLALNALFIHGGEISLWTYALGQLHPLLVGTQVICATLDVFVPLVYPVVSLPFIY